MTFLLVRKSRSEPELRVEKLKTNIRKTNKKSSFPKLRARKVLSFSFSRKLRHEEAEIMLAFRSREKRVAARKSSCELIVI